MKGGDYMQFDELLKDFRDRHGLTQEELARKLDVTVKSVSFWENNKGPSKGNKKRLTRRLKELNEQKN